MFELSKKANQKRLHRSHTVRVITIRYQLNPDFKNMLFTIIVVNEMQKAKPTVRSPEMLAPARIPVAAGKKMANAEKKVSSSLKSGPKFSMRIATVGKESKC